MHLRSVALSLFASLLAAPTARAQSLQQILDERVATSAPSVAAMPPGWHVTTGPGALLYDPRYFAGTRWSVETEIFLFQGESNEGFGLFFGGDLRPDSALGYTAFIVRRDGSAAIVEHRQGATRDVRPWTSTTSVRAPSGKAPTKQILTVNVDSSAVHFTANGVEVFSVPPSELRLDGAFGLRVGGGLNVHVARLDVSQHLAPVPGPAHR